MHRANAVPFPVAGGLVFISVCNHRYVFTISQYTCTLELCNSFLEIFEQYSKWE